MYNPSCLNSTVGSESGGACFDGKARRSEYDGGYILCSSLFDAN